MSNKENFNISKAQETGKARLYKKVENNRTFMAIFELMFWSGTIGDFGRVALENYFFMVEVLVV